MIGTGDCTESSEIEKSSDYITSGFECSVACANDGYWMASWSGRNCYCEANSYSDKYCDSYANLGEFRTYKILSRDGSVLADKASMTGLVIGIIVGILFVSFCACLYCRKKKISVSLNVENEMADQAQQKEVPLPIVKT
jgi:hypothetical protein